MPVLSPKEAGALAGSLLPEAHPVVKNHSIPGASQVAQAQPSALNPGEHTDEILEEFSVGDDEKRALVEAGAICKTTTTRIKAKL